jgi:O-antigen ligase
MDPAFAVATGVRATGVVLVAALAALAALAPTARARALGMAGALVLTPALLLEEIWDTPQLHSIRDRPSLAVGGAVAGVLVVVALAAAMRRWALLLPVLAVAALPFRIPIEAGGSTSNLLVPLYLVVAAGALAYVWTRVAPGAEAEEPPAPVALEWVLLGSVVLYAVQATYSTDFTKALEQVVFFYVPFALLFVQLREVEWTRTLAVRCLGVLTGLALLFVGIGFVEYSYKKLLFNPKVIDSNQFESYFRVNSLFFDPNIYGRFLAVVMICVAAAMLWAGRTRTVVVAGAVLAVLWGGLVVTFSQSSFAALLVGLAVLGALRWNSRRALALAAGAVAIAAVFVIAFPSAVKLDYGSSKSVDKATSGRADLISGGTQLFGDRPVYGWGAGSFAREYRKQRKTSSERAASASHTIPVTVAAEQGVVGLALYLVLLVLAFLTLLRGARGDPLRAAVAASFAAIVLHTFLYAAFLEDPITWALLGAGLALAVPARRAAVP